MKNYTVVGLFASQENAPQVSESLAQSGICDQKFIIYKTAKAEKPKSSYWKRLLGLEAAEIPAVDKLITSVEVNSEQDLETVKKSFEANKAVKIYEFQDMTLEEAKNLDYVKRIVALRAKSHIYAVPQTTVARKGNSEGLTAEVKI